MRAVLCKELTGPENLVVQELPDPGPPGASEVTIEMRAVALNFPDVLLVQGKYQFKPDLPFSPGGEVAGVITHAGADAGFSVGDRVVATMPWGGMREQVVTESALCTPLPSGIPFESAAAFLTAYGTTHYALKQRAQLQAGETLVVLGAAGGVGTAAIELGKRAGARVIACASSEEKLVLCRKRGADETINYTSEDLKVRIKALTGGQGADVVYDPVGGPYSEQALRALAWSGRLLVVGFAAGEIPKIPLNLILLKSCQVIGVFWGAFTMKERDQHLANTRELMAWLQAGELSPHIGKVYPLADGAKAIGDMMNRKAQGKLVITP